MTGEREVKRAPARSQEGHDKPGVRRRLHLDHLADAAERAGGWVEAVGGDGGGLDYVLPRHLWAGAGLDPSTESELIVPERRLVVPTIEERSCLNRRCVMLYGRRWGWRLSRPACGLNGCAPCRVPKAIAFGTTLVRVLCPGGPAWMGFLDSEDEHKAWERRVRRGAQEMASEQALSRKFPSVSSERSEGDFRDNARGVQIHGYAKISVTRGWRRRWLGITDVNPNRDRRRNDGRVRKPMRSYGAQAVVNYATRFIQNAHITRITLANTWLHSLPVEAEEAPELDRGPAGWVSGEDAGVEDPPTRRPLDFARIDLPANIADTFAVLKAAGAVFTPRRRGLPEVHPPVGVSDEEFKDRLELTLTRFYKTRRKP